MNLRRRAGFTLVELLLAAALIPVISFAIYGNLSSGIEIWKRLHEQGVSEDVSIFYEKISADLRNTFHYTPIPLAGGGSRISFATRIRTKPSQGGERGIGEVTYAYDSRQQSILREEKNVSQLFREQRGDLKPMLKDVLSFQVSFFYYDETDKIYLWKETWGIEEKKLPLAVRINFDLMELDQKKSFIKTVEIPVGS